MLKSHPNKTGKVSVEIPKLGLGGATNLSSKAHVSISRKLGLAPAPNFPLPKPSEVIGNPY